MATKVLLKKSSVPNRVPLDTDLEYGELALNYADGKLYYKTSNNSIDEFVSSSATVAGVASVGGATGAISTQQLLDFIKQVDGTGSGLDADTLDGTHASSFATLSGSETLTNKTLSNPTISYPVITGTVTANGTVGAAGQVLQSTGTGVQWVDPGTSTSFNVLSRVGEIPIILTSILATYLNFDNQTFRTSVGLVDTRTTTITVTG
jgi:hypothetical protein